MRRIQREESKTTVRIRLTRADTDTSFAVALVTKILPEALAALGPPTLTIRVVTSSGDAVTADECLAIGAAMPEFVRMARAELAAQRVAAGLPAEESP